MIYHGFLYSMIIGSLLWSPTPETLAIVVALIQAFATLLFPAILACFVLKTKKEITVTSTIFCTIYSVLAGFYLYSTPGRPEPLTTLILLSSILASIYLPPPWRIGLNGIILGIIAAIHPMAAILILLTLLAILAWIYPLRKFVSSTIVIGALSFATFIFLLFYIYPFPPRDWFHGTLVMGNYALMSSSGGQKMGSIHIFTNGANWMLPLVLALAIHSIVKLRKSYTHQKPQSPLPFYLLLFALLAVIYRVTIVQSWGIYNLAPIVPVLLLAPAWKSITRPPSIKYSIIPITILLLALVGPAKDCLLRFVFLENGVTLRESRSSIASFQNVHPKSRIAFQESAFMLTPEAESNPLYYAERIPDKADYAILPQAFTLSSHPPALPNATLLRNNWTPSIPKLFGLPLARDHRGCGFAIYKISN